MHSEAHIIAGVRTPIGSLGGTLSTVPAPDLGAACLRAILDRTGISPDEVDEVIMGNVVSAGIGQNPARQATLKAGLPSSVSATTVNKVCGSGLQAIMFATQAVCLGDSQLAFAGGMENMSLAPYLLPKARSGYRMGHGELLDAVIHDGLWDCYGDKHMGIYGDQCADQYGFTKEDQDNYAVRSYSRARRAIAEGVFDDEIVPIDIKTRKATKQVSEDEEPVRFDEDKLRSLRPAFGREGSVTAGNASSINDGASAVLIASGSKCASLRIRPVAGIIGASTYSAEPEWFTTAPVGAVKRVLAKVNWSIDEVDLFEINEAFATVAMVAEQELSLPPEKVNIYGGAVALGHPIGCSGARILVTLLTGMQQTDAKRGIASLCIGGGEAVAMAIERFEP